MKVLFGMVLALGALVSVDSFAQVKVGSPNGKDPSANRGGRSQLDRIEDSTYETEKKVRDLEKQLERIESKLGHSRPGRGEIDTIVSSVQMDCVDRIFAYNSDFDARLNFAKRCRPENLDDLKQTCDQTKKEHSKKCYEKLVGYFDSPDQKADIDDVCSTYTFECEREWNFNRGQFENSK